MPYLLLSYQRENQRLNFFTDRLKSWPLYVLPHHLVSRVVFRLTRIKSKHAAKAISKFVKLFNVDMQEALHESPIHYGSFNEFFTRELKPGLRPVTTEPKAIASPVDGCVSQLGKIDTNQIFQAKGRHYTALDLLGGREADAAAFTDGQFATLYLSPRDYHRMHMPVTGKLQSMHYVPGRLFSVAPHTVRVVPRLFARNERVVAIFDTDAGKLAMVLVGAINVAAIETVWAGLVTPPNSQQIVYRDYNNEECITLEKGAEMGRFNMGSTVILLMEKGTHWHTELAQGSAVRMGELIGKFE